MADNQTIGDMRFACVRNCTAVRQPRCQKKRIKGIGDFDHAFWNTCHRRIHRPSHLFRNTFGQCRSARCAVRQLGPHRGRFGGGCSTYEGGPASPLAPQTPQASQAAPRSAGHLYCSWRLSRCSPAPALSLPSPWSLLSPAPPRSRPSPVGHHFYSPARRGNCAGAPGNPPSPPGRRVFRVQVQSISACTQRSCGLRLTLTSINSGLKRSDNGRIGMSKLIRTVGMATLFAGAMSMDGAPCFC